MSEVNTENTENAENTEEQSSLLRMVAEPEDEDAGVMPIDGGEDEAVMPIGDDTFPEESEASAISVAEDGDSILEDTELEDTENSETSGNAVSIDGVQLVETSEETLVEDNTGYQIAGMGVPFFGLSIVQVVVALSLIVVVLQQSKTASSMMSSGNADSSYWSQNKGRSVESKLERLTIILAGVFFIVTMILSVLK